MTFLKIGLAILIVLTMAISAMSVAWVGAVQSGNSTTLQSSQPSADASQPSQLAGSILLEQAQESLHAHLPTFSTGATGSKGRDPGATNLARKTNPYPSNRSDAAMVYDAKDGYVVLFGGEGLNRSNASNDTLNDTWKFSGGVWTQLHPAISPPGRSDAAIAYDSKDGYVVMFGGFGSVFYLFGDFLGDTWKFVGGNWTELSAGGGPQPSEYASMTYDAKDGYLLYFGGYTRAGDLGATWSFVHGAWKRIRPATHPSDRDSAMMTYDAKDGYVLLFGGEAGNSGTNLAVGLSDSWKYSGGMWTNITPAKSPPGRLGGMMAYDSKDGYVVLFGGLANYSSGGRQNLLNDTWTFSGGSWSELPPTPHLDALDYAMMTFDAKAGYVLLFGGARPASQITETWKFVGGTWTKIRNA
jgi:hypothetical protein